MYILINRQDLCFVALGENCSALVSLAAIELPHKAVQVVPLHDERMFAGYTELELLVLYKNTTGVHTGHQGSGLVSVLLELASRVPVRDIRVPEIFKCEAALPEGTVLPYTYVPGMSTAVNDSGLYGKAGKQVLPTIVPRSEREKEIAQPGGFAVKKPSCVPLPATKPTSEASGVCNVKKGSITAQIFEECEVQFALCNDRKQARLQAIGKLVEDGVNKNSAAKGSLMWLNQC